MGLASFTGTIFGREVDANGTPLSGAQFVDLGEVRPLEVQVTAKKTEAKSRKVATAGQIIGAKASIDTVSGNMTLYDWNAFNLARFFSGAETEMTASSGTMSPTEFTAPVPGKWIYLGHKRFTSLTVTSSPAGTTYVNGTDYQYNASLGLFTTIAGGAIDDGATDVLIGGGYAAESGYKIEVGTKAQTRIQIMGEHYNEFTGITHTVDLDCVQLLANKGANLVSEEDSEGEPLSFDLVLITVNGTSPGRIDGIPM